MADDDVQLTDLEVIQRYSLAVRGATASRADLVAALQADLTWLQGGRRSAAPKATAAAPAKTQVQADAPATAPAAAPAAKAAAKAPEKAPAKAAPAKKAPARSTSTKRKA